MLHLYKLPNTRNPPYQKPEDLQTYNSVICFTNTSPAIIESDIERVIKMIKVYRQEMARWCVEHDEPMMIKVIIKQYTNLITPYSSELWKQTMPTAGEIDIGIIKVDFSTYLYRMLM